MADSDSESSPPRRGTRVIPPRKARIRVPTRATRSTAAYFSSQSSPESDEAETVPDSRTVPSTTPIRVTRSSYQSPQKRKASSLLPTSPEKRPRRQRSAARLTGFQKSPKAIVNSQGSDKHGASVFPAWQTLPYAVWLRVFDFVAGPIRDTSPWRHEDVTVAIKSLLSGALACRCTAEPALANLYLCPPFQQPYLSQVGFAGFVNILSLNPATTVIKYRPKVEILRIDISVFLSPKHGGTYLSLEDVARTLPRLSGLELYHQLDTPPFRRLDDHVRWKISQLDLMKAFAPLDNADLNLGEKVHATELRSWRWNARLALDTLSLQYHPDIHRLVSFRSLRKVAYINYQLPSWGKAAKGASRPAIEAAKAADQHEVQLFAASIASLTNLQHLVIESSTLANGTLLGLLPNSLSALELINCWEIASDDFTSFLKSHGHSLQRLTLMHCQALNLNFLSVLQESCPRLVHLEVDLSYFKQHEHYADNKPVYENLLEIGQVPTWPSSMQGIEIIHMRNLDRPAAEMFFQSLVDNAASLPLLRRLQLKVILDIEWRERLKMRECWVEKMKQTFLRKTEPPKQLATLPQSSIPSKQQSTRIDDQSRAHEDPVREVPPRRSERGRVEIVGRRLKSLAIDRKQRREIFADDEGSTDELAADHPIKRRAGRRVVHIARRQISDEQDQHDEQDMVHGLCDLVDIQIDNQRPMERQFEMGDFLDTANDSDSDSQWEEE